MIFSQVFSASPQRLALRDGNKDDKKKLLPITVNNRLLITVRTSVCQSYSEHALDHPPAIFNSK
jgi:hypothetical protein